jgi:phosphatidylglycerol lysyltransferase
MAGISGDIDREKVHLFLKKYGRNSMSSLLLYDGLKYYFCGKTEALIGYYDTKKLLIGVGEPVCPVDAYRDAVQDFVAFGKSEKKDCAFLLVTDVFHKMAKDIGFLAIKVGEDFIFDVQTYVPKGNRAKKVRSAINQIRKRGAVVREYNPATTRDNSIEDKFRDVARNWIQSHRFKAKAFFIGLKLFDFHEIKRYFYVEYDGKIVALMACLPIYARKGYLFEDLIREPSAPNGVSEIMVVEAIKKFKQEGAAIATFGVSPKIEVRRKDDLPVLSRFIVMSTIKIVNTVLKLRLLYHYRKKYHTATVESCYLLKYPKRLRVSDIFGILRTFNIVS